MAYEITIMREPGRHLAVTRFDARPEEMGARAGQAFGTVAARLAALGIGTEGPAVACYGTGEVVFHVAMGFVVSGPIEAGDGVEPLQLPAVEVATTTHVGPYEQLGKAYDAIQEGARSRGREVDEAGLMWEEYWTGPDTPPEQHRTVVSWPLKAAPA